MYGVNFLLFVAYVNIGWLQIKFLPEKLAPYTMLIIGGILLLMRHTHIMMSDADSIGLSDRIPIMMASIKLSYVAWNY